MAKQKWTFRSDRFELVFDGPIEKLGGWLAMVAADEQNEDNGAGWHLQMIAGHRTLFVFKEGKGPHGPDDSVQDYWPFALWAEGVTFTMGHIRWGSEPGDLHYVPALKDTVRVKELTVRGIQLQKWDGDAWVDWKMVPEVEYEEVHRDIFSKTRQTELREILAR